MKNRFFWGAPHTETGTRAFQAVMQERAEAPASGGYAAVAAVHKALEHVTRRSAALLQADVLFAALTLLMLSQAAAGAAGALPSLLRWAFALVLVSGVLLLPNLALVWASDPAKTYASAGEEYEFAMPIYRMRAARYTAALSFSVLAFVFTLASLAAALK